MDTPARGVTFAAGALVTNLGIYRGLTLRETAGAVATIRLWDNASAASGVLLDTIALLANGSVSLNYYNGRWFTNGVFAQVVAGTVEGTVFIG
jgi:hypothetical protein